MTSLNRMLTVLVFAVGGVLVWALIAQTEWAATRSLLGVGEFYENPITPLVKTAGAITIAIALTKLVQRGATWFSRRILGREPRSRIPAHRTNASS